MTAPEVATRVGISVSRVYAWADAGLLPSHRIGRRGVRFLRAEVERWVSDGGARAVQLADSPEPAPPAAPSIDVGELLRLLSGGAGELELTVHEFRASIRLRPNGAVQTR